MARDTATAAARVQTAAAINAAAAAHGWQPRWRLLCDTRAGPDMQWSAHATTPHLAMHGSTLHYLVPRCPAGGNG